MVKIKKSGMDTISRIVVYTPLLVGLAISPIFSLDSIHISKLIILIMAGFSVASLLIVNFGSLKSNLSKSTQVLLVIWLLFLILNIFLTKSPRIQAFYGREGRYNGFVEFLSLTALFVATLVISKENLNQKLNNSLSIFGILSIAYGLIQLAGIDPVRWSSSNLNLFGFFGNPNFLSAFIGVVTIPIIVQVINKLNVKIYSFILGILIIAINTFLIYETYSYQGFFALGGSIAVFIIGLSLILRKKIVTILITATFVPIGLISILGTFGHGPLGHILHKGSVISRGDFFRSAFNMGKDNLFTGVGLDSFGDNYLKYRDTKAALRINAEYADSAHNYFLDIFANAGIVIALIYVLVNIIALILFIRLIRENKNLATLSIFSAWVALQIQSLVSPLSYFFLIWIFVIDGWVIASAKKEQKSNRTIEIPTKTANSKTAITFGIVLSLVVTLPLTIRDARIKIGNDQRSAQKMIEAIESFPRGSVSYMRAIKIFQNSNIPNEELYLAKKLIEFNPYVAYPYLIVITSNLTTKEEKMKALNKLKKIDPNQMQLIQLQKDIENLKP